MRDDATHRWALAAWIGVILLVVVPWWSVQDHAHWDRVGWVPFGGPLRLRDIVLNVLLYVPFGYLHACQAHRPPAWRTLAYACALSCATELTQVFSHGRFPSGTDVASNVIGAALGAWGAALRVRPRPAGPCAGAAAAGDGAGREAR